MTYSAAQTRGQQRRSGRSDSGFEACVKVVEPQTVAETSPSHPLEAAGPVGRRAGQAATLLADICTTESTAVYTALVFRIVWRVVVVAVAAAAAAVVVMAVAAAMAATVYGPLVDTVMVQRFGLKL